MLNEELFGTLYYTKYNLSQIISGAEYKSLGECYLVNNKYPEPADKNGFGLAIIRKDEVDADLAKQDENKAYYKERKKRQLEYKAEQFAIQEMEKKEKAEREYLYGFDTGMSLMQKGKVLKTLLTKLSYTKHKYNPKTFRFEVIERKVMTRKDYIVGRVQAGGELSKSVHNGKTEYAISSEPIEIKGKPEKTFSIITKTEYDFATFLLKKAQVNNG
ncbi:MAG: hypothetical protein RSB38_08025 [Oscillospiraceae bacterium]